MHHNKPCKLWIEKPSLYCCQLVLKSPCPCCQDATKFALVNEGRKRYSQSINIKTVGGCLPACLSLDIIPMQCKIDL